MKAHRIGTMALGAALAAGAGAALAQPGYLTTSRDTVVTTASGICVHTGSWTPALAIPRCDATPLAVYRPAAAAVPAPQPKPAPLAQAEPAPAPQPRRITLSTDVLFEFDSAELRPGAEQELGRLAQDLRDARVESVLLVGHADRIGAEDYNLDLSRRRAEAVRGWLAGRDLRLGGIEVLAKGESEPVNAGLCQGVRGDALIECLQPNRRVEVEARGETMPGGASAGASR